MTLLEINLAGRKAGSRLPARGLGPAPEVEPDVEQPQRAPGSAGAHGLSEHEQHAAPPAGTAGAARRRA